MRFSKESVLTLVELDAARSRPTPRQANAVLRRLQEQFPREGVEVDGHFGRTFDRLMSNLQSHPWLYKSSWRGWRLTAAPFRACRGEEYKLSTRPGSGARNLQTSVDAMRVYTNFKVINGVFTLPPAEKNDMPNPRVSTSLGFDQGSY